MVSAQSNKKLPMALLDPKGGDLDRKETATVRADADLLAEIRRGLTALKRGKAKLYTLEELFAD
jgi:hypothetical protein